MRLGRQVNSVLEHEIIQGVALTGQHVWCSLSRGLQLGGGGVRASDAKRYGDIVMTRLYGLAQCGGLVLNVLAGVVRT